MTRLLDIQQLSVTFGGLHALKDLNFHVDEGEIVGVIGPNGAGKTTFFNMISGMVRPTAGDILFEGESLVGLDPNQVTQRGIARTFQNVRLFANMTIAENVMVSQHCRTSKGSGARCSIPPGSRRRKPRSASMRRKCSASSVLVSSATA